MVVVYGTPIKALSLTQPWATLIAIGAKRIETRSWGTNYRGPLAIHAAKGLGSVGGVAGLTSLCLDEPFRTPLFDGGVRRLVPGQDLPLGAVLAVANIVGCLMVEPTPEVRRVFHAHAAPLEKHFGDYMLGRYMWLLGDVIALPEPIPVRGARGLWDWEPDGDVRQFLRTA